jgi:hypothetical protein
MAIPSPMSFPGLELFERRSMAGKAWIQDPQFSSTKVGGIESRLSFGLEQIKIEALRADSRVCSLVDDVGPQVLWQRYAHHYPEFLRAGIEALAE